MYAFSVRPFVSRSCPNLDHLIPRASAEGCPAKGGAAVVYSEARHSVLVTRRTREACDCVVGLANGVPDQATEVVVPGKHVPPGLREINRCDPARDLVVAKLGDFAVGAQVENPARGIIGSRAECAAAREERDRVDVRLVAREGVRVISSPQIPHLGGCITGPRHKQVAVRRASTQAHCVAFVALEGGDAFSLGHVPQHARGVSGARKDLGRVDEAAARQVSVVRRQLLLRAARQASQSRFKAVDGAQVVQSTTCHHLALRRFKSTRHHPRRPQRNGIQLGARRGTPDDEFAVLGSAHLQAREHARA